MRVRRTRRLPSWARYVSSNIAPYVFSPGWNAIYQAGWKYADKRARGFKRARPAGTHSDPIELLTSQESGGSPPKKLRVGAPQSALAHSTEIPYSQAKMAKYQMHAGYVSSRWRTKKAPNPNKYMKSGSVGKVEIGFTAGPATAAERGVVYAGHGLALDRLGQSVWRAVIRRLFRKSGVQLVSWNAVVYGIDKNVVQTPANTVITINLFYKTGSFNELQQYSYTVQNVDTFADVVTTLWNNVRSIVNGLAVDETIQFTGIEIDDGAQKTDMNLAGATIDWMFKSNMMVQNRTAPAETANGTQADRVDANPIHGFIYEGYGNGFVTYNEGGNIAPTPVFDTTATRDYGKIQFNLSSMQTAEDLNLFIRPPSSKSAFVGTKKMARVYLQPGQIRRGYISYQKTMRLDSLVMMENRFRGTSAKFPFGKWQLFGFDKVCRAGNEADYIEIGCEINQVYGAKLHLKPVVCLPDHDIAP